MIDTEQVQTLLAKLQALKSCKGKCQDCFIHSEQDNPCCGYHRVLDEIINLLKELN